ncbi:MAG: hypothetical protein AB7O26_11730, partial [Planctomycetaceae bacterium]
DNIPYQIQLLAAPGADESIQSEILAALTEANENAVKQALGLTPEESGAPPAGLPPGMELPPGMPPGGLPAPAAGMLPNAGAIPGAKMAGGLMGTLRKVFVPDAAAAGATAAAGDVSASPTAALWSAKFAEALSKHIQANESDRPQLLGLLASLPADAPREKLHEFLQKSWGEGPSALAGAAKDFKLDMAEPEVVKGLRKKGKRGDDDDDRNKPAEEPSAPAKVENQIESFGENWFDPGALVVLKSFNYADRPRDAKKPAARNQPIGSLNIGRGNEETAEKPKTSAAQQKREEEREARLKAQEARYDWRDAIERYIHVLNERFDSVAIEPPAKEDAVDPAAAEESAADEKKIAKADAKTSAKGSLTPAAEKILLDGIPFPLHDGAQVVKEFHGRWPTASGPGAAIVEPLTVHYVRIEGDANYGKAVTHYKGAIKTKKPSMLREIEQGRWIDAMQEGSSPDHDRSVDVFVTHEPPEPGAKPLKEEPIVVEILLVEIPHVGAKKADAKSSAAKR